MLFNLGFNSLTIAKQIIKNTGLDENLGILKQKKYEVPLPPKDILKIVMALCTCNLVQTMKADFVTEKFSEKQREAITKDYVLESFRNQDLIIFSGKEEADQLRLSVMAIVEELQRYWKGTEDLKGQDQALDISVLRKFYPEWEEAPI